MSLKIPLFEDNSDTVNWIDDWMIYLYLAKIRKTVEIDRVLLRMLLNENIQRIRITRYYKTEWERKTFELKEIALAITVNLDASYTDKSSQYRVLDGFFWLL